MINPDYWTMVAGSGVALHLMNFLYHMIAEHNK